MDNKQTLLQHLKSLYSKIFLVSLHNRINRYHSSVHTKHHHEINHALYNVIDEIVQDVARSDSKPEYTSTASINKEPELKLSVSDNTKKPQTTMISMTINGLSLYFKKQKVQENDPAIEARLRRCVWDHVHSAHRFARSGDAKTAKIHADIASDAMKTLSHYMSSVEYSDFLNLITEQIEETVEVSNKTS